MGQAFAAGISSLVSSIFGNLTIGGIVGSILKIVLIDARLDKLRALRRR